MMKTNPTLPSTKKQIYNVIAQGTISKAELIDSNPLSSSSLTRLLDEMLSEGLIQTTGQGTSTGGRRPLLYKINPDHGYIFGLEISRLTSTLGLFDMDLNIKSVVRWRMDETLTPQRLVDDVSQQMKIFLRDHGLETEQVIGLGIGAVGPLDRENGVILDPLYFPAKGWKNTPICRMFKQQTGIPAVLENGANTALLGEHWSVRREQIAHALYIHTGMSLRSSMMSYGRIVHGKVDMEGSIGQMIIQTDGPRLNAAGNYGALEALASVQALEKHARAQAKMGHDSLLRTYKVTPEQINFDVLTQALAAGDPAVETWFEQSALYFGVGLANLINVFHPEIVFLGGALINSNPLYFQTATDIAKQNTYYYPTYEPKFSKGQLQEDAVVTGAALIVRNQMEL